MNKILNIPNLCLYCIDTSYCVWIVDNDRQSKMCVHSVQEQISPSIVNHGGWNPQIPNPWVQGLTAALCTWLLHSGTAVFIKENGHGVCPSRSSQPGLGLLVEVTRRMVALVWLDIAEASPPGAVCPRLCFSSASAPGVFPIHFKLLCISQPPALSTSCVVLMIQLKRSSMP